MRNITLKLCALTLIVLFSQCSKLHFMDRKYTKGRYHEKPNELSVKKKPSKSITLPDIDAKTDISIDIKKPVEKQTKEEATVLADKNKLTDATAKESTTKALPKTSIKKAIHARAYKKANELLSKLPFSEKLLKNRQTEIKSEDDDHLPSTILSIVGFALGILALLLAIIAIVDSFIIEAVSVYFYVAIALGLIAVACGIVALVMGRGKLRNFEKTFAVLAIALGAAGALIALIWSFIISLIFATA